MVQAWLKIGGIPVKEWNKPVGEPGPMSIGLSAVFDSTYFTNNTSCTVLFKAKDNFGRFYEASDTAPIRNNALLANRSDFYSQVGGKGCDVVAMYVQYAYDYEFLTDEGWSAEDEYDLLGNAAVLYLNTHGTGPADPLYDNATSHTSDSDELIYALSIDGSPDYGTWMSDLCGTGSPPFNSSGNTLVHLAFFDCCWAGATDQFLSALEPHYDGYGQFLEDRAIIGWSGLVPVTQSEEGASLLFDQLDQYKTIWQVRNFLVDYSAYHETLHINYRMGQEVVDDESDMPFWGDPYMRIKGAYTGSNTVSSPAWYW